MNPRVLIPILIILLLLLSLWSMSLDGGGGILPGAPDTGAAPVGERPALLAGSLVPRTG
ncbi:MULTISPECIES: hypothetical protein [unclassified Thioalkalivibrio]|uniref:hypothetical protein n=1 Tax=unclassified Thioalkalivibrio TaxID=2621013 RepID=UPI0003807C13|nr:MULTISPECIES: hypothetical protein [unclassified Thioalkalivibrio]